MSDDIRRCGEHGYYVEDNNRCPDCGIKCDVFLESERRRDLSGFMSWALRHDPSEAGISVDDNGWADAYELSNSAQERYNWVEHRHLASVVSTDSKGRFEVKGNKIRAVYGHSISVTIDKQESAEKDVLYHGTPQEKLQKIKQQGLRPMTRQHVHLTDDVEEARNVGERHSDNIVVLEVDIQQFTEKEDATIEKRNNVYVSPPIPWEYITEYS